MPIRKIVSWLPAIIAAVLFLPGICLSSSSEITSISQLNHPRYRVGSDSDGPVLERTRENFPDAQILKYNDFLSQYLALQSGKIDALIANESEFISAVNNGLEHVRLLPGYVGKPVPTAAGISDNSKIPGLKEKFNAFIAELKSDGTLSAMYKRWVYDNDTNMPAIDVPENSDVHLTVATTGVVMPFSFFINSDVTGFDIELARRFAAYLGATVEFKIYGFGSILMAIKSGAVDIALSNLYVTKESAESVTFSDIVFDINCIAAVYDENKTPAIPQNETGNFEAFRGKRIGVPVGSVISEMVKERIPDAEIFYFDMLANFIAALESRKIDAFAMDEPVIYMLERENSRYTHSDKNLGSVNNAFIFSKSPENNPLADEINEYIRRMRSDGTLDEIRAIWFGGDESRKIIPDYKNFLGTKGTIRIATNNDTPPFSYIKDGRLAGYDVDVILRFCREKGYRPDFSEMNFSSVIPAVSSRKCDIGIGAISMTEERADSVRFSEPVCSVKTLMLILKSSELNQTSQKQDSQNTYASRKPKYTTLAELDGKPIGVQTGVFEWADFVEKTMLHSQIVYFNTFADIAAALKTHKIEAFLVDEPVYNLMAAEDKNLARIDAKIDDTYDIAYGFPKNSKGKKLCDEMSDYIRKIKASGELDAITAKWEGNDEAAKTLPDYKHFPAHNGVLTMATEGEYPPFNYYRGNEIAGLEIDIAARFCEAYGYGLDVASMAWDSIISAVVSGKFDFAGAYLDPAEAHTDNMYFSQPYLHGRSVIACLKADDSLPTAVSKKNEPTPKYKSFSELDGKTIGMQPGIIEWEEWAAKNLPHSKILYYNTYPDLVAALKTHKIEGLLIDFPVLALMAAEDNTLAYIDEPVGKPFGYSFFCAQTNAGKKLCDEISEYIRKIKASGELDAILSKWQGADENAKIPPDFKSLPAKNGTLTYAAEGSYPPFSYYKGTKLAGIDIDIAAGFCREYGYGLGVQMMLFDATIPAINSGKVDFAGDFTPSDEHQEAVYFSEPYCNARSVIACLKDESQNVSTPSANLAGKIIGVQTGTTCAELVPEKIPSSKLSYYNSLTDELTALKAGKVDAICCSLPAAIFAENEDPQLARINPPLRETYLYPIFARTEKGKRLCNEYSEFLKGLWDDGTIDALNAKWLGKDEGKKTLDDYSQLPSTKGTIKMAVDATMIPFAYVRDNMIVGYDIELAARFCKAKGYSLQVENMTFTGVLSSVKTGKFDFTQSMNKTTERAYNTLFTSTPTIKSGNVLLTMKPHESPRTVNIPLSDFTGKRVGLLIGSDSAKAIEDKIPGVKLRYFDAPGYVLPALRSGRIDAFYCAEPTAVNIIQTNSDLAYIPDYVSITRHTTMFPKTAKGRKLCAEYADFLKTLSDDGTIDTLTEKWISGTDDSRQVTEDYSHLSATNGTLTLSVTEGLMPFVFVKDKRIQGYDIDLAVMFCKHKGYGLKIELTNHNGVLSSLKTGKSDFSYSVQWTKERDNTVLFSPVPNAVTGSVLLVERPVMTGVNMKLSDFAGKKIGVVTGTNNAIIVKEKIPSANLVYYESPADTLMALKQGKIDALSCGSATSVFLMKENDGLARVSEPVRKNYHSVAFVSSDKGNNLRNEYGEFLKTLWEDGTIRKLYDKWIINNDESTSIEDYSHLPSTNGTLKMAVDPAMIPFVYVRNNKIIGYDIELAVMFCKAKGYGLDVVRMSHSGVLAALASGKCDFSYAIEYTDERAKSVLFSEVPNVEADNILVVMKPSAKTPPPVTVSRADNHENDVPSFWEDIASSFRKTFIREDRWKLFAEGIMNTMIITVSAIFCGMLLGFIAFMFCRTGNKAANVITKFSVWLIKGTPIVVLLMILYYVIFGHVNISGIVVAIIAFTLTFGTSVYRMLTFGTGAVDRGQTEAAYALGFTDMRTFFTVILPQAALHFMPSFKEEVTMLIKSTSVVGYIAVQDLTKMGDIVRSRTYEAFFPLIAVALIYFVLAGMLNIIVNIIQTRITPSKRKPEDILRGIDTRGNDEDD